jgi:membrane protease subunit HflC
MKTALTSAIALVILILLFASGYTIKETEQVIITQFGEPVGTPITEAGLRFKAPFIQVVNRMDKRVLEWDGTPTEMPTKDKLYISVNTFARWRISDPQKFFIRLRDERSAQSRLSDILGSETRNTVAAHDLVELVRTTKDRKPTVDATMGEAALSSGLPVIRFGRSVLEKEIFEAARPKLVEYGIDLMDMRLKRINYNPGVAAKIFQRMVSERQQIASRYRAEGEGEAAKILGSRERDLKQIESEAYRQVQTIEGKADAEASAIYAQAYNQSPQAREFYGFLRSMDTYRTAFDRGTSVVLTTEDGFLRYLKGTIEGSPPSPATHTPPASPVPTPPRPPAPLPPSLPVPAVPAAPALENQ